LGIIPIPIHVCGKSITAAPSRWMGWALRPFGFQGFPVNIIKEDDKTIIQIETGKNWMVYECGLMASWAFRPLPFTNKIPVKIFKDGTKNIIQIEAFDGVFCDCNANHADDDSSSTNSNEDLDESFENNTDSGIDGMDSERKTPDDLLSDFIKFTEEEEESLRTPVDLLNDFIKFTEEEEEFLRARDTNRRSCRVPRHKSGNKTRLRRHRSSSARVRLTKDSSSLALLNIIEHEHNNKVSRENIHVPGIVDNLPFKSTIDAEVKSLLKRRSKMSQSIENIKNAFNTFSTKSPKLKNKLKERSSSSLVIII